MSTPWNPVQVEEKIREIANEIADGVKTCYAAYAEFLTADRDYDRAFAKAYMNHQGPAHEKKYAAELATHRERVIRDIADAAYRYADRGARAKENELRAWQSVGASIREQYRVAGVGER